MVVETKTQLQKEAKGKPSYIQVRGALLFSLVNPDDLGDSDVDVSLAKAMNQVGRSRQPVHCCLAVVERLLADKPVKTGVKKS